MPLLVVLAAVGGLAVLARRLYLWDPDPPTLPDWAHAESGLGGWLWLPVFGLAVSPLMVGKALFEVLPTLTVQQWSLITLPTTPGYHPLMGALVLVEFVLNLALIAGALLLLVLAFKRRSNMPRVYVGWALLAVAGALIDTGAAEIIPLVKAHWTAADSADAARVCVVSAIWIAYFVRSARVRRTFVGRLAQPPAGDAQSALAPPA